MLQAQQAFHMPTHTLARKDSSQHGPIPAVHAQQASAMPSHSIPHKNPPNMPTVGEDSDGSGGATAKAQALYAPVQAPPSQARPGPEGVPVGPTPPTEAAVAAQSAAFDEADQSAALNTPPPSATSAHGPAASKEAASRPPLPTVPSGTLCLLTLSTILSVQGCYLGYSEGSTNSTSSPGRIVVLKSGAICLVLLWMLPHILVAYNSLGHTDPQLEREPLQAQLRKECSEADLIDAAQKLHAVSIVESIPDAQSSQPLAVPPAELRHAPASKTSGKTAAGQPIGQQPAQASDRQPAGEPFGQQPAQIPGVHAAHVQQQVASAFQQPTPNPFSSAFAYTERMNSAFSSN